MRRLFVGLVVLALVGTTVPALANNSAASNYRNEDHQATALFVDDAAGSGVFVSMGESIGGMELPVYGYMELWDATSGTYCDGMSATGTSVVHDYYFNNNGAFLDADIPVSCDYGATTIYVHVVVTWHGSGQPDIQVSQHTMTDPGSDYKSITVTKVVRPNIESADIAIDYPMSGTLVLEEASVRLFTGHGVTPHPLP